MKKLFALFLAICMIASLPVIAAAEVDLSAMSWDELIELQKAISKEQMSRDEWQEVTVPVGTYLIGEDIPAGKWRLTCNEGTVARCYICEDLSDAGTEHGRGYWDYFYVYNPASSYYKEYEKGSATEVTVNLKEGMYFIIGNNGSAAVFHTYTGNSLGFK